MASTTSPPPSAPSAPSAPSTSAPSTSAPSTSAPSTSAPSTAHTLRLTPLGGVGHFGRNCLLVEDGASGAALVVDCGARFAGPELPGFDLGLPDLERLATLGDRVLAYVVTHGHEDHIGALPFALRERPAPVVCTRFTRHFVQRRCDRYDVAVTLDVVDWGEERKLGPFTLSFAAVSHSIPGAASLVLRTPTGVVVHSGDFRVDDDPVFGPKTDLATLERAAGDDGVACLLADSTGALSPGRNPGERSVEEGLQRCFVDDEGKAFGGAVFVALFASHLQRLALLGEVCRRHGRRLLLLGRGLKEALQMGLAEGALALDDVLVSETMAKALPRHLLCVAVTGSQGEPQAVLARLAKSLPSSSSSQGSSSKKNGHGSLPVGVQRGDRVVWSSRVIPGNELAVQPLVDAFVDAGAVVVVGRDSPHVSGHGHREDLRLLLAATRPRCFVALHGNPANLVAHGGLASALGVAPRQIAALRDGHTLVLERDAAGAVHGVHVVGERAREPAAQGASVAWFPRGVTGVRDRLGQGGVVVVVDDGASEGARALRFVDRGVFPPFLDDDDVHARARHLVAAAVKEKGGLDDDVLRAIARAYRGADRWPPEFVVVAGAPAARREA